MADTDLSKVLSECCEAARSGYELASGEKDVLDGILTSAEEKIRETADKLTQMCMRFSGYDARFGEANVDEYIKQAEDYNAMMKDSKANKIMEFYIYRMIDHPLNAVRAYEGRKWAESNDASQIFGYLESGDVKLLENVKLPVPDSSKKLVGQNFTDVETMFQDAGFTNVHTFEEVTKDRFKKSGVVLEIAINGKSNFDDNEWYPIDAVVTIRYKA